MSFRVKGIILAISLVQMTIANCETETEFQTRYENEFDTKKIIKISKNLAKNEGGFAIDRIIMIEDESSFLFAAQAFNMNDGSEVDQIAVIRALQGTQLFSLRVFPQYWTCLIFGKIGISLAIYERSEQNMNSEILNQELESLSKLDDKELEIKHLLDIFFYLYPIAALHSIGIAKVDIFEEQELIKSPGATGYPFIGSFRNSYFHGSKAYKRSEGIESMASDCIHFGRKATDEEERMKLYMKRDLLLVASMIYNKIVDDKKQYLYDYPESYEGETFSKLRNEIEHTSEYLKENIESIRSNDKKTHLKTSIEGILEMIMTSEKNNNKMKEYLNELESILEVFNDEESKLKSRENLPQSSIPEVRRTIRAIENPGTIAKFLKSQADLMNSYLYYFIQEYRDKYQKIRQEIKGAEWFVGSQISTDITRIMKNMVDENARSDSILQELYKVLKSKIADKKGYEDYL
jgi:hypothetical protein